MNTSMIRVIISVAIVSFLIPMAATSLPGSDEPSGSDQPPVKETDKDVPASGQDTNKEAPDENAPAKAENPRPSWVDGGCPAFRKDTGAEVMCSLGHHEFRDFKKAEDDMSLCIMAAKGRARSGLSAVIVDGVLSAMEKAGCENVGKVTHETSEVKMPDGTVTQASRVKLAISGSIGAAGWVDPEKECYILVTIDLDAFSRTVFMACGKPEKDKEKIYKASGEVWESMVSE